jgi:phospholipase/carboxylesterase
MRTVTTESDEGVILNPADGPANAAVIWMHGLGADGYDFVPLVPELQLPDEARVRFIFPHAPVRPVTVNAGYEMRAWYDITELNPEGRDDEAGLLQARSRIEQLINTELAAGMPSTRIVLAGFSQGGAIALHTGLRFAQQLAGIIALSCYLPLREKIGTEMSPANSQTPVFMCHGREDVVVLPAFGEQSRDVMLQAGLDIEWRQYSMGHSLCRPEIFDISVWLKTQLKLN